MDQESTTHVMGSSCRCMVQISFRTQDPNIKTGTIRNLPQTSLLIHDLLCVQNPRIRSIYRKNLQTVWSMRKRFHLAINWRTDAKIASLKLVLVSSKTISFHVRLFSKRSSSQNVVITSVTDSAIVSHATFLFLPHFGCHL